eukprot:357606-Chlamydomonas_euryale.AAC.1
MGTGSAVAHRAVDSMMGPREMTVNHENNHAPAPPTPAVPMVRWRCCVRVWWGWWWTNHHLSRWWWERLHVQVFRLWHESGRMGGW